MFFHNDVNFINYMDRPDNYDRNWNNSVLIRIFKEKSIFSRSSKDNIYLYRFCVFIDHGICNVAIYSRIRCEN